MYYVSLVAYNKYSICNTIEEFMQISKTDEFKFTLFGETSIYKSMRSIPYDFESLEASILPQSWCIHSSESEVSTLTFPLLNGVSMDEANDIFLSISSQCSWSFFTWGGTLEFLLLVFLTRNKDINDKFDLACKSHEEKIGRENIEPIVSYSVSDHIENYATVLILEAYTKDAHENIWEACNCNNLYPTLISNNYITEEVSRSDQQLDFKIIDCWNVYVRSLQNRSDRVQIKKDGHAASTTGTSKMATGNGFGVIPEVKTL